MNIRSGTAPDSWGIWFADDPQQVPWPRFLDEVVEVGYEWIELGPPGYLPTMPAVLRAEVLRRGLKVASGWIHGRFEVASAWPEIEAQLLAVGERLAALGAGHLVLISDAYTDRAGQLTRPTRLLEAEHQQMVATLHQIAELARARFGLRVLVHNHAGSCLEHVDQLETLLLQSDPSLLALCLDTGWLAYLGYDVVAFMRRHHARIPYLHLKTVQREVLARVQAEGLTTAKAVDLGVFCEPADGSVNFPALCEVLHEIDFDGWAIVEQDMYPAPFDKPLPIAKRTRTYLRDIGMG